MSVEETLAAEVVRQLRAELTSLRQAIEKLQSGTDRGGYLSVKRAAEYADVHEDTIRAWIKEGKLPEHRAGRELRVRRDELDRFMAGADSHDERPTVEAEAISILSRRRA